MVINGYVFVTDINECEETPAVCDHQCLNVIGGYRCSCKRGYELSIGDRCVGEFLKYSLCSMNQANLPCLTYERLTPHRISNGYRSSDYFPQPQNI